MNVYFKYLFEQSIGLYFDIISRNRNIKYVHRRKTQLKSILAQYIDEPVFYPLRGDNIVSILDQTIYNHIKTQNLELDMNDQLPDALYRPVKHPNITCPLYYPCSV